MKLESIRLKNFRSLKNVEMRDIPRFCVILGANGTGKSTLFGVFGFLKTAFDSNVNAALASFGGARGFDEVRSRDTSGPIEIELKFREDADKPLITYFIQIDKEGDRAIVSREILKYRRGSKGQPWHFLDFQKGMGEAVTNELETVEDENNLVRESQTLKSADLLAVKGLANFQKFPAVVALGELIENWHISDFHIDKARMEQESHYAEHLDKEGRDLRHVVQYYYQSRKDVFDTVIKKLGERIPGITNVDAKTTEEGRVLLRFQDGAFADPFLSQFVSDGTIKMLAYLVLLYDPTPFSLLCVEEPENQLYPLLLEELIEEFRSYARRGGQVLVSTHSPEFLNGAELEEVFWLEKKNGYTAIVRASSDEQIVAYMNDGDKMGYLWKQGFLGGQL
jgi:predicted ATPase